MRSLVRAPTLGKLSGCRERRDPQNVGNGPSEEESGPPMLSAAIRNTRANKLSLESQQRTPSIGTRVITQRNTRGERGQPPAL